MEITVKIGNIKIVHSDKENYGNNHSSTVIKLLKEMVVQAKNVHTHSKKLKGE